MGMKLSDYILHPMTSLAVTEFIARPVHALLVTGPNGIGKSCLAECMTGIMLQQLESSTQTGSIYDTHAYVRRLRPEDNKAISIESVREIQHFLSLIVPGAQKDKICRVIVIENSELLTIEAQNALLKTLEEPPEGTALILTACSVDGLLPTIQSRVRQLNILPPVTADLRQYFTQAGYTKLSVDRALNLCGDLPGLAAALLQDDETHPLVLAVTHAKGILQSKAYERLLLVDGLSKQKELVADILFVLGQMSRTALMRSGGASADRWRRVLSATYDASGQLRRNTQSKLVLTNLMLAI